MRTRFSRSAAIVFVIVGSFVVNGCGVNSNETQVLEPVTMSEADLAKEHDHSGSNEQSGPHR
jgi:hypothetical protein